MEQKKRKSPVGLTLQQRGEIIRLCDQQVKSNDINISITQKLMGFIVASRPCLSANDSPCGDLFSVSKVFCFCFRANCG